MANRDYLTWAKSLGFVGSTDAIVLELYSERLQQFRLAAQGHGAHQPPGRERARVARYFDPLPFWYDSLDGEDANAVLPVTVTGGRGIHRSQLEVSRQDSPHPSPLPQAGEGAKASSSAPSASALVSSAPAASASALSPFESRERFPLCAITQRPMFMYHSWGSQNAWLRQIATRNFLYLHPDTAAEYNIGDGDEVWVESAHGRIRVPAKHHAGTARGTVWTWNAIGKREGAWSLKADAPEYTKGFLLNHVIDDLLPPRNDGYRYANADPVTGQAAWFDLQVRISRCEPS
jgi:anaerobic selenocysteine-containing dehydrogenase